MEYTPPAFDCIPIAPPISRNHDKFEDKAIALSPRYVVDYGQIAMQSTNRLLFTIVCVANCRKYAPVAQLDRATAF